MLFVSLVNPLASRKYKDLRGEKLLTFWLVENNLTEMFEIFKEYCTRMRSRVGGKELQSSGLGTHFLSSALISPYKNTNI